MMYKQEWFVPIILCQAMLVQGTDMLNNQTPKSQTLSTVFTAGQTEVNQFLDVGKGLLI